MKLYDRFMETCDRLDNEDEVWGKIIFYLTSFVWLTYLMVFIHELGHAITATALGGTVTGFVIHWNGGGSMKYLPPIDILPYEYVVLNTLVLVSGGIAAMLLFMALSHKTKWFLIPAALCLLDGFLEALYVDGIREPLSTVVILTSWWAACTLIHNIVKHSLEPKEQGLKIPLERNWRVKKWVVTREKPPMKSS